MLTTTQKIAEYCGCFEAGEQILTAAFVEAYGHDEAKAALIQLRREGKVRLVAVGLPRDFCESHRCELSGLIQGENERFGLVEVL